MKRPSCLVVAAALLLTGIGGTAAVDTAAAGGCSAVHRYGHWSYVEYPGASTQRAATSVVAVDRAVGNHLFFTDGATLMRSLDGGCTWATVYTQQTSGAGSPGATIKQIVVGAREKGSASHSVYAMAADPLGSLVADLPVTVVASHDDGKTWAVANPTSNPQSVATMPQCSSAMLSASASAPRTVYLACSRSAVVGGGVNTLRCSYQLLLSTDGAATWSPAAGHLQYYGNCDTTTFSSFSPDRNPFVVDPGNPAVIFGTTLNQASHPWATTVLRSNDHGASFTANKSLDPYVAESDPGIDAAGAPGKPTRFVLTGWRTTWTSLNGGRSWQQIALPVRKAETPVLSGAVPANRGVLVVRETGKHYNATAVHNDCTPGLDIGHPTSLLYYYDQQRRAFARPIGAQLPPQVDYLDLGQPQWDGQPRESFYFTGWAYSGSGPGACSARFWIVRYTP